MNVRKLTRSLLLLGAGVGVGIGGTVATYSYQKPKITSPTTKTSLPEIIGIMADHALSELSKGAAAFTVANNLRMKIIETFGVVAQSEKQDEILAEMVCGMELHPNVTYAQIVDVANSFGKPHPSCNK